jgi:hypothetical protein
VHGADTRKRTVLTDDFGGGPAHVAILVGRQRRRE